MKLDSRYVKVEKIKSTKKTKQIKIGKRNWMLSCKLFTSIHTTKTLDYQQKFIKVDEEYLGSLLFDDNLNYLTFRQCSSDFPKIWRTHTRSIMYFFKYTLRKLKQFCFSQSSDVITVVQLWKRWVSCLKVWYFVNRSSSST